MRRMIDPSYQKTEAEFMEAVEAAALVYAKPYINKPHVYPTGTQFASLISGCIHQLRFTQHAHLLDETL